MPIMNITFRKNEQIMKILTILAIITSTISVSTSTYATENNLVKDIIIDSQVFYYYGTSRKKSTTEYNNNLPTSTTGYYRSGKRSYLKTFTGPNITSYKTWFESGTLRSEYLMRSCLNVFLWIDLVLMNKVAITANVIRYENQI